MNLAVLLGLYQLSRVVFKCLQGMNHVEILCRAMSLIPVLGRQSQVISEFEASLILVYSVISRTVRDIQKDPVSTDRRKKETHFVEQSLTWTVTTFSTLKVSGKLQHQKKPNSKQYIENFITIVFFS